ncbi:MAG: dCMP deaminase family protein [Patescibacteria group bacterium]
MKKQDLIIHLPVVHKGYLDFFDSYKKSIDKIYLINDSLLEELSEFKPDIASIKPKIAAELLKKIGYPNTEVLSKNTIKKIAKHSILLINDEVSRNLYNKFLSKSDVKWDSVFLRWDRTSVLSTNPIKHKISNSLFDKKMMKMAYMEAQNSSDWWRQVGAVLVKNKKRLITTYNQSIPNDHTPYQVGAVRDYLNVGERPDLSNTIHAEQWIIAQAAKEGVSLKGGRIYVTHFPCAVCAKIIAYSGIEKCYYGEGSANLDGETSLRSVGVEIISVKV